MSWSNRSNRLITLLIVVMLSILITGCTAAQDDPLPPGGAEPVATIAATSTPDYGAYQKAWQEGPHAHTYALEKGPNTYCARCHSPANWDPAATIDPPPNCVSCKFAFEPEPRIAAGNPLVPEEAWQSIGCNVCHPQNVDGVIEPGIAWRDPLSGYYQTVVDSTALCSRCHRDTETLRHHRTLGEAAHAGFTCTDCHDAHSTAAGCASQGCHQAGDPDWLEAHDEHHQAVACVACHDGSGLQVGPLQDGSAWVAFRTTELLGRANTEPYQSHQLQREVSCQRCHFENNPWGLRIDEQDE